MRPRNQQFALRCLETAVGKFVLTAERGTRRPVLRMVENYADHALKRFSLAPIPPALGHT